MHRLPNVREKSLWGTYKFEARVVSLIGLSFATISADPIMAIKVAINVSIIIFEKRDHIKN